MTSQDTGGAGFPGARAAARSAGRVRSPRWLPASPGRNARGWGATGGGSCVLDVGRAFVQYAQPLASRSPPSWSRPSRKRRTGRAALRRCHRDPGQAPGGADGGRGARPPPPRPRGVAPASGPVSTQRTSTGRASMLTAGIVGILRLFVGIRRRCGVDVRAMGTDDPPALFHRPAVVSRAAAPPRIPARASVSEVMTPKCLRSEETAQQAAPTTDGRRPRGLATVRVEQLAAAETRLRRAATQFFLPELMTSSRKRRTRPIWAKVHSELKTRSRTKVPNAKDRLPDS